MKIDEISVLIVEDNRNAARLLETVLEDMGVRRVRAVSDGKSALGVLSDDAPGIDIVLCDWRMPEMSGLELLEKVRAKHPDMPFMMISANADAESLEAARGHGVNAYLTKPYIPEDLEKKFRFLVLQI